MVIKKVEAAAEQKTLAEEMRAIMIAAIPKKRETWSEDAEQKSICLHLKRLIMAEAENGQNRLVYKYYEASGAKIFQQDFDYRLNLAWDIVSRMRECGFEGTVNVSRPTMWDHYTEVCSILNSLKDAFKFLGIKGMKNISPHEEKLITIVISW